MEDFLKKEKEKAENFLKINSDDSISFTESENEYDY